MSTFITNPPHDQDIIYPKLPFLWQIRNAVLGSPFLSDKNPLSMPRQAEAIDHEQSPAITGQDRAVFSAVQSERIEYIEALSNSLLSLLV
jgi:hypothetical protein